MVGVLVRFEVEEERRKSQDAERGRAEDGAFEAMGGFFREYFSRRPGRPGEMVGNLVEETLNAGRRFQRSQPSEFGRRKVG